MLSNLARLYCGFEDAIEIFDVQRPGEGERLPTTPSKKSKDGLKGERAFRRRPPIVFDTNSVALLVHPLSLTRFVCVMERYHFCARVFLFSGILCSWEPYPGFTRVRQYCFVQ